MNTDQSIPVIDVSALITGGCTTSVAAEISRACRGVGFFYIVGHGVDDVLQEELERLSRQFFEQDLEMKLSMRMELGGRAWRGYFPVGNELTSGQPDRKEGLYFGAELPDDHPKVASGVPLHGRNLFPNIPRFRETVLEYLDAMTQLGHALVAGIALSLGLEPSYFRERYTHDPTILFRIFHYPPVPPEMMHRSIWGVGEHTDYGLLTILRQDNQRGLQVKVGSRWIAAPPIPGSFVCNIGDMLDHLTGGQYRSTVHRVCNDSGRGRYSFPFFFDPNFDAQVKPIFPDRPVTDDARERWDMSNVHEISGTYGQYVLGKVSKVFPDLHHGN